VSLSSSRRRRPALEEGRNGEACKEARENRRREGGSGR
jgi:hypothetical protein